MINLYPHQIKTVDKIRHELKTHKRILVSAQTGFGKTKLSQYIIEKLIENGKKVLFTVPRIKLAEQTKKSFGFGNLILGDRSIDSGSNCTIASVQSLYSRKITQHFDFIFIDECHFAHGSEYMNYILETYSNSYIIGLSATPIDENGYLLNGYGSVVNEVSLKELIAGGYLTDVEVYTSLVQPDLSNVQIVNGDYNQDRCGEIMKQEKILSNTVQEWIRLGSQLKTIVFASNIDHCERLHAEFQALGYKSVFVHSKMPQIEIDNSYQSFHLNEAQLLINVDMATFGFDEPSIKCMLFARGVKSMRLYKQMVGRGIRSFKGKDKCLMIDCANVVQDNGFPTDELVLIKKPIINNTIDRLTTIQRETDGTIKEEIVPKERIEYLEKIGSLIDLYANKVYLKEQGLVDDCKTILKRAGFYVWRQNSGKANIEGRWVVFTDRNGLPDITLIYKSVYIGLELKLPAGRLTDGQKITLPELVQNNTAFFIIENVIDLFHALEVVKDSIIETDQGVLIKPTLFDLSTEQLNYRQKYKLVQKNN